MTRCLGILFNSVLCTRLERFFNINNLIADEQIGFRAGCRTSDHIFKFKTIIDKYLNKSKKLYTCFIDLRSAFDTVIHPALFLKLINIGIGGKFFSVLKSMYSIMELRIKLTGNISLTPFPQK